MKKLIFILLFGALLFVALAVLQVLPEPVQTPVNEFAGKLLPQKKALEKKQNAYSKFAEEAAGK